MQGESQRFKGARYIQKKDEKMYPYNRQNYSRKDITKEGNEHWDDG